MMHWKDLLNISEKYNGEIKTTIWMVWQHINSQVDCFV